MKGVWAVVLLVTLAGCTAPEEEEEVDLWQSCPQWVPGPAIDANLTVNASLDWRLDEQVLAEQGGRPLDLFVLTLTTDAPVEVKVSTDVGRVLLKTEDASELPAVTIDGEAVVRAFLSPVTHGSDPVTGPVTLSLEGDGLVDITAEPYYRVCGAPDVAGA